jgi:hypothetical protein
MSDRPLTAVEQFYVDQHPYTPLAEIASALGRDEASLVRLVPERAPAFERLLQPIQRQGKTVGTVWNPAASAVMDEKRKQHEERPPSSDVPADKTKCNHSPMGDRRKAPAIKLGRPISDIAKDTPKRAEPLEEIDHAPVAPEQRKTGTYSLGGGRPSTFKEDRR